MVSVVFLSAKLNRKGGLHRQHFSAEIKACHCKFSEQNKKFVAYVRNNTHPLKQQDFSISLLLSSTIKNPNF